MTTRFIELAGEINTKMPNYVVQKITDSLNNFGKSIKDSQIVVLGLSYKKNIDDLRESPSLHIIDILTDKGAIVSYHDPFLKRFLELEGSIFILTLLILQQSRSMRRT